MQNRWVRWMEKRTVSCFLHLVHGHIPSWHTCFRMIFGSSFSADRGTTAIISFFSANWVSPGSENIARDHFSLFLGGWRSGLRRQKTEWNEYVRLPINEMVIGFRENSRERVSGDALCKRKRNRMRLPERKRWNPRKSNLSILISGPVDFPKEEIGSPRQLRNYE